MMASSEANFTMCDFSKPSDYSIVSQSLFVKYVKIGLDLYDNFGSLEHG